MKRTSFLLAFACALCTQVAFAQTAPTQSTPNMQSSSSTNTGTQTSSPTTTGMNNDMVTPPAQTRERMADGGSMRTRSMRKTTKMKHTSSGMKTKTTM